MRVKVCSLFYHSLLSMKPVPAGDGLFSGARLYHTPCCAITVIAALSKNIRVYDIVRKHPANRPAVPVDVNEVFEV